MSSCPNKKWKNVYVIPAVTKPCCCYFYDSRTDIKLLGCTDNNNNTHLPNDSNSTSTKIHKSSNKTHPQHIHKHIHKHICIHNKSEFIACDKLK